MPKPMRACRPNWPNRCSSPSIWRAARCCGSGCGRCATTSTCCSSPCTTSSPMAGRWVCSCVNSRGCMPLPARAGRCNCRPCRSSTPTTPSGSAASTVAKRSKSSWLSGARCSPVRRRAWNCRPITRVRRCKAIAVAACRSCCRRRCRRICARSPERRGSRLTWCCSPPGPCGWRDAPARTTSSSARRSPVAPVAKSKA